MLAELTGADEIVQGREDRDSTERSFGARKRGRVRRVPAPCGMPEDLIDELARLVVPDGDRSRSSRRASSRRATRSRSRACRTSVLVLRGHADGHIVLYDERDGRMLGGDVLLQRITPNVGAWEDSRPDPLDRLPRDAPPAARSSRRGSSTRATAA